MRIRAVTTLLIVCLLALAAAAADDEECTPTLGQAAPYLCGDVPVRVGLVVHTNTVRITPPNGETIEIKAAPRHSEAEPRNLVTSSTPDQPGSLAGAQDDSALSLRRGAEAWEAPSFELTPDPPTAAFRFWASNGVQGSFRGAIQVVPDGLGRITAINALPLEDYLLGVVGAEMSSRSHPEALRAQAIVARTYTLASLGRHAADGFDLCATVDCQVYRGGAPSARAAAAVRATAGLVVAREGRIVRTVYHSTCGGISAGPADVRWGAALPYRGARCDGPAGDPDLSTDAAVRALLASHAPRYCSASPMYRWRRTFTLAQANALVRHNLPILLHRGLDAGRLKDLAIAERAASGRVHALRVTTASGVYTVFQDDVRWLFGTGRPSTGGLPSTLCVLDAARSRDGRARRFTFTGAGWGHGLGLCQTGAQARARRGESAARIIAAYYPGCELLNAAEALGMSFRAE